MAERINVLLEFRDRATNALRSVNRALRRFDVQVKDTGENLARTNRQLDQFGRRSAPQAARGVDILRRSFVALAAVTGTLRLSNLAAEADETANRFEAVFGPQVETASGQIEDLADRIGRSARELAGARTSFQSFFVGLQFGGDRATELSRQIQELTVDFASFNNLSDAEASNRFISALSGSAEVLDRFGINLRAAALDQQFLAQGLDVTNASATEQQKVLARLAIIAEALGSQGAIGDAERTSESFANQIRQLQGNVGDLGVSLGRIVNEVLLPYVQRLNEILPRLTEWVENNRELIRSLLEIGAALAQILVANAILGRIVQLAQGFQALTTATTASGVAMRNWGNIVRGSALAAAALLVVKTIELVNALDALEQATQDLDDQVASGRARQEARADVFRDLTVRANILRDTLERLQERRAGGEFGLLGEIRRLEAGIVQTDEATASLQRRLRDISRSQGFAALDRAQATLVRIFNGSATADTIRTLIDDFGFTADELSALVDDPVFRPDGRGQAFQFSDQNKERERLLGLIASETQARANAAAAAEAQAVADGIVADEKQRAADAEQALQQEIDRSLRLQQDLSRVTDQQANRLGELAFEREARLSAENEQLDQQIANLERLREADPSNFIQANLDAIIRQRERNNQLIQEGFDVARQAVQAVAANDEAAELEKRREEQEQIAKLEQEDAARRRKLAQETADAEIREQQRVNELRQRSLEQLGTRLVGSPLQSFFESAITGAQSFGDAFQSMVQNIGTSLARLAAEILARRAVLSLVNALGGGGGQAGGFALNLLGRNAGGPVPGTGPNVDSVPAMLTPGEFVIQRPAVEALGVPLLNLLNQGVLPASMPLPRASRTLPIPRTGYNTGGEVARGGTGGGTASPVLVADEDTVEQFVAGGLQGMLNVITANPDAFNAALGRPS